MRKSFTVGTCLLSLCQKRPDFLERPPDSYISWFILGTLVTFQRPPAVSVDYFQDTYDSLASLCCRKLACSVRRGTFGGVSAFADAEPEPSPG